MAQQHSVAKQSIAALRLRGFQPVITAQIIVEFWTVVTRPLNVNGLGWHPDKARAEVDQLTNLFPLLPESSGIFPAWLRLVDGLGISGKASHDARLVAVMQTNGVSHLMTFNLEHFRRFSGVILISPDDIVSPPSGK